MNEVSYDIFWRRCIAPAADELCGLISESVRQKYGMKLDDSDETKRKIYDRYNEYRIYMHNNLFKGKNMISTR